jgi:HK97 family phage major capsid protein
MNWITNKHIAEKRATANEKVAEAGNILSTAKEENRDVSEEERSKFDTLHNEAKKIGEEVARLEAQHQAELNFAQKQPLTDAPYDRKDIRRYSLLKAVREMSDMTRPGLTGLEKEVSDEIASRTGKNPQGFYMPMSLPMSGRVNNALDTTAGAGAIQTTVDAALFIEILRAKLLLQKVGARFIGDLVGNLALPRRTAKANAYWVTDGNSPTAGAPTIGQVVFSPNICGAYTDLSRNFIKQTSLDAEMFARDDLAKSLAHEIDRAAFNGSGEGAEPQGLLQSSAITAIPLGTNGAAPTWASLVELETTVALASADIGEMSYVMSPAAKGVLKTTPKTSAGYPVFMWEDNEVNGYPAYSSAAIPSDLTKGYGTNLSAVLFGNFNDLVVCQWGGIDILVDPYTGSSSGTVRVVALADVDIKWRHNESFAKVCDMVTG